MTALFKKLLEMSFAAAVVIVIIMLVRLLLRRAPKKWSYLLWLAAAFRLCCPVSFGSVFSIFNLAPARAAGSAFASVSVTAAPAASTAIAAAGTGLSTPQAALSTANAVMNTVLSTTDPGQAGAVSTAQAVLSSSPTAHALPTSAPFAAPVAAVGAVETLLRLGAAVWLLGLAIMLIIGIIRYIKVKRTVSAALPMQGEKGVYLTEGLGTPFILGLIRPRVYVPYGLIQNELAAVLAHERCHLKRGDNIIKALAYVILSVHWFNPFCWLAYYLMNRDMEMSCDERVIASGFDPCDYGSTLLVFAAQRRFPAPEPLAFGESSAGRRITNVLSFKKPKLLISVAAALICCAVLAACSLNAKTPEDSGSAEAASTAAPTEQPTETAVESTQQPTGTAAEPTQTNKPAPEMYQPPERPRVVNTGSSYYHINEGEELDSWGTTYYLTEEGKLYAFGSNQYAQIGDGTFEFRADPQLVMTGVASIMAESSRVFALKEDGTLWTWGYYTPWEGRIESCGFSVPTQILSGVAEYDVSFALTENGELWATEHCENGELIPFKLMEDVKSYDSLDQNLGVLAVTRDKRLYALYSDYDADGPVGYTEPIFLADGIEKACAAFDMRRYAVNDEGKLLLYDNVGTEEAVTELLDDVYDIYAFFDTVYAIRYDGSLWGYGDCEGWASLAYEQRPVKLLDDVKYFTADFYLGEDMGWCYSFAIKNDNTLWAWGPNQYGELGVSDEVDTSKPICVAEDAAFVTSDGFSTYVIKTDGSLWAAGYNGYKGSRGEEYGYGPGLSPDDARLGDGTRTTKHEFVKIMDNAVSVCLSTGHVFINYGEADASYCFSRSLAMTSGDDFFDCYVWGWGYNGDGCLMQHGEEYLLEPVFLGASESAPPYYTVSASERELYTDTARAILGGESVENTSFSYYGQYVHFKLEDDGLKAYNAKVNYFKYVPNSMLPIDSANSPADPIAVFPRELGERAYRSLIENVRNSAGFWEPADDADLVYQGFIGDNWFALATLDDSMQDLQTHCIFYNDNGDWREIKACPGVDADGSGTVIPLTAFGACVTDANTAYMCYFTKQLWDEETGYTKPYVYRTADGGASWRRLDITLPESYLQEYNCAPLSPVFDGRHGVIILSGLHEGHMAWLESFDNGVTWEYHING